MCRRFLLEALTRFLKCTFASSGSNAFNSHHVRKAIARVLTVLSQTERASLKQTYAGKKFVPKDLRVKKTRAIRRQLTDFEASRETVRQHKKTLQNKMRKYAIKA